MPANEIAGFHVDLTTEDSGEIYYRNESDRTIIQFDDVARLMDNGNVDFQIILHRDGIIDLDNKNVPAVTDDATVGIQNGTRDKGLTISYGEPTCTGTWPFELQARTEWFAVSPGEGTVFGQRESKSVIVPLNASDLPSGIYTGQLELSLDSSHPRSNRCRSP